MTDDVAKVFDNSGKHNGYKCEECAHIIVTVDRAAGVTPFMIGCAKSPCAGLMQSRFYHAEFMHLTPSHEWYKPDSEEYGKLSEALQEWVDRGCLLLREIVRKPPVRRRRLRHG